MTVIGIIGIIGSVEYSQAQTIMTIEPIYLESTPQGRTFSLIYNPPNKPYWHLSTFTATISAEPFYTDNTYKNETSHGHVFLIAGNRIETNPDLPDRINKEQCDIGLANIKYALIVDPTSIPRLQIPDNITPKGKWNTFAIGFDFYNDGDKPIPCNLDLDAYSQHPIIAQKELRYTLYNQSDKKAYHFSPRENITQAQPIPLCTDDSYSTHHKTLKGDTKMCYGKHGDNMVIITKTVTGFYGAADTVTEPTPAQTPDNTPADTVTEPTPAQTPDNTPANSNNDDSSNDDSAEYIALLKRLYLPPI